MQWLRASLFLVSLGIWISPCAREEVEARTNAFSLDELQAKLVAMVDQPRFVHAAWGIKVVSLETGEIIFDHEAEKLLKPASNAKLFTGALALDRFGSGHRIRTSVYALENPDQDGTVNGDLIIYGQGDPSMAARFRKGDYDGLLKPLAEAIVDAGVRAVTGGLVGDETFFVGPPYGATWSWEDLQYYYGAQVSALSVQDNVIDIILRPGAKEGDPCSYTLLPETDYVQFVNRTVTGNSNSYPATAIYRPLGGNLAYINGSVPLGRDAHEEAVSVHDPARWFVIMLAEELARAGVKIEGDLSTRSWPANTRTDVSTLKELASVESVPMRELVARMLKPSQNLYAQLLFLQAGAAAAQPGDMNTFTENLGARELRRFADQVGIPAGEIMLEEGSGLSRAALVTPNAIVQLLRYMHEHPEADAFRESLPVAGVDGTIRNRMKAPGLKGNVRAKTGTLSHVNALSGYLTTQGGEPLAFSLLLNAYSGSGYRSPRAELDEVATLLWRLDRKPSAENEKTGREMPAGHGESRENEAF